MKLMDFRNPAHWRNLGLCGTFSFLALFMLVLFLSIPFWVKVIFAAATLTMSSLGLYVATSVTTEKGKQRVLEVGDLCEQGYNRFNSRFRF